MTMWWPTHWCMSYGKNHGSTVIQSGYLYCPPLSFPMMSNVYGEVYIYIYICICPVAFGLAAIPLNPCGLELTFGLRIDFSSFWKISEKQNCELSTRCTTWWLNQPLWKICSSNWIISQIGVKITNLWNHNLEMYLCICTSSEDCTCVSVKNHAQMHQNKAAPKKTSPSHLFPSCTCQHSPIHDNWNKFMKHIPMYITFWKVPAKKNQRLRGWGIHVLLALSARKRIMKWSNWLLLNMYSEFPPGFATDHGQTIP